MAEASWTSAEQTAWDGFRTQVDAAGPPDETEAAAGTAFDAALTAAETAWTTAESTAWTTYETAAAQADATWTAAESAAWGLFTTASTRRRPPGTRPNPPPGPPTTRR